MGEGLGGYSSWLEAASGISGFGGGRVETGWVLVEEDEGGELGAGALKASSTSWFLSLVFV